MADFPPQIEQWRPYVDARSSDDAPTDFALAWIQEESGGNVCDRSGMPGIEAGLFQLDTRANADLKFGATFADLMGPFNRGACTADALTDAEMEIQIGTGMAKIADSAQNARAILGSVGLDWSGSDFGSAVKQIHALPAVLTELLPKITSRNGHPPSDWNDFIEEVIAFPVSSMGSSLQGFANSPSKHGLRNRIEDTMVNAAIAGAFWTGGVGGLVRNPFVQIGLAAFVVWGVWKLWGRPQTNPRRRARRRRRW